MSRAEDSLVVCDQCGQTHRWKPLTPEKLARCSRCDAILGRGHRLPIESVLALVVTAAVAYAISLFGDVLTLELRGAGQSSNLPEAIAAAWRDGQEVIAVVTALTALVAPTLFIGLRLYLLVPLAMGVKPAGFAFAVRALHLASRWNMVEVFLIGALLSLVRLVGLADAAPGLGLYALVVVAFLFAAIEQAGVRHLWWQVK